MLWWLYSTFHFALNMFQNLANTDLVVTASKLFCKRTCALASRPGGVCQFVWTGTSEYRKWIFSDCEPRSNWSTTSHWVVSFMPKPLDCKERACGTYWMGDWLGFTDSLKFRRRERSLAPARNWIKAKNICPDHKHTMRVSTVWI